MTRIIIISSDHADIELRKTVATRVADKSKEARNNGPITSVFS